MEEKIDLKVFLEEKGCSGLIDKRNVMMVLGCYCNKPSYAINKDYMTTRFDYIEDFHRIIWGAITNIVRKHPTIEKLSSIEIENELQNSEKFMEIWNMNNGGAYIERAIASTVDKLNNIGFYRDELLKRSIVINAMTDLGMDIKFVYDEKDELTLRLFNEYTSMEVMALINNRLDSYKNKFKTNIGDNMSFHLGDGIDEVVDNCKNQDSSYGYPFQSGFMTTIFRGMKGSKFIIRSSKSGGGKTKLI